MTIEGDEEMDIRVSWARLFEDIRDFGTPRANEQPLGLH